MDFSEKSIKWGVHNKVGGLDKKIPKSQNLIVEAQFIGIRISVFSIWVYPMEYTILSVTCMK